MNCPDKQMMQDFLDGELPEDKANEFAAHIRSCEECKAQLEEISALQETLDKVIQQDKCPSLEELEQYAEGKCSPEQAKEIQEHLDFCSGCRSQLWMLQASPQELSDWQDQQAKEYAEFEAGQLGYDAAKQMLSQLLPDKIDIVDKIWQPIVGFVLDIKNRAIDSWPVFNQQARLAGALGFGEPDPQNDAASIIMAVAVYISQGVSEGEIPATEKAIQTEINKVSEKFGAGKELRKRLIETLPGLILDKQ